MVSCCYVVVSLTLRGPDEYGSESFQYEDKTAWTVPLQRVAGMGNEREQELGQFGSVTGPTKALEMLNDGTSFESACNVLANESRLVRRILYLYWVTCSL